MLTSVVKALQALAIIRAAESEEARTADDQAALKADIKAAIARASDQFVQAAYAVSFDLVSRMLAYDEITTEFGVRYSATAGGGGFVIQKIISHPDNPGMLLKPDRAVTSNWLQLMIDLPELLETLEVK